MGAEARIAGDHERIRGNEGEAKWVERIEKID
jgi:hypothetical protein